MMLAPSDTPPPPGGTGITVKFGLGVGGLFALFLLVAATGYFLLKRDSAAEDAIQASQEIQEMVFAMDRGLEKARRLHGDFFLQYPVIGLAAAHERYAQPSVREIARVIAESNRLKKRIAYSAVSDALRQSEMDLNLYLSTAKRFADTSIEAVELVTRLATPVTGIEARLHTLFISLRDEMAGLDGLLRLYGEMRTFAQHYRLTRERAQMQSAFNVAFTIRKSVENDASLPALRRETILRLLDRFTATATEMLDVDVAIKSKFNDFILQAEAVRPVADSLVRLAEKDVSRARAGIAAIHQASLILLATVTLAGLVAAALMVSFLNRGIRRRVLRLTAAAAELRRGNMNTGVPEEGGDELSDLARTFNVMAARVRELVEGLERKVEERTAELAASERRFRGLFEHSASGVVVYEPVEDGADFLIRDCNAAVERIEGVRRQEILDRRLTEVFPGVGEFGLLAVLREVGRSGASAHHPMSYYKDGRLHGWRENSVYRLPSGEVVAVYEDRTAQKQAEIDRAGMESRLQRAQKMEAIGLMAGGVAHDLNNILSGIVGYPELLLMQLPEDSKLRRSILAIQESGQRAAAVVADLLTVARGVASTRKTVAVNDLVREYLDSPEYGKLSSLHPRVVCTEELAPAAHNIHCSAVHIKKCLMNLVTNAMEAIGNPDGRVAVSTANLLLDEETAREHGVSPGPFVALRVADNGGGIAEADLAHIFEPFYTKKVMGRSGTGLGLAVVWNTVQDHGGFITVKSSAKGTTFALHFPASSETVARDERGGTLEGLKGRGERILVVDDEPQLRDIACGLLSTLGYEALAVDSGEKAVAHLEKDRVDLVLLDMLMEPGINGRETYERLLTLHPGQKALVCSGFSESEEVKKALALGAHGLLKKPYTLEDMGRKVREALTR